MANDHCFLRRPVPSFETCVPGAGKPHSVTGQEDKAQEECRNGLKQPGAVTRPIATGDELRLCGCKRNKRPEPKLATTCPAVPADPGLGRGVPLSQPALRFEPDGRAWLRRVRTDAPFSCPPRWPPQICVQGGYTIFPNWVMLRIRIPRHTHTHTHTRSLTHIIMHAMAQPDACTQEFDPIFPFSSLLCAGRLLPWTHVCVVCLGRTYDQLSPPKCACAFIVNLRP